MVKAVASLAGPGPALDVAAATSLRVLPNAEQQAAFLRTAAERLTSGRLVVDQHEINPAGYAGSREWYQHGIRFLRRPRRPAAGPPVHRDPPGRFGACPQRPPPADAVAELVAEPGRVGLRLEHAWRNWWREQYTPGDPKVVAVFQAP